MDERRTRKHLIDPLLTQSGWTVVPFSSDKNGWALHAVEEFETNNGPADYALFHNGEIIGVVEAKKEEVDPQTALNQEKRYATGIRESSLTSTVIAFHSCIRQMVTKYGMKMSGKSAVGRERFQLSTLPMH